MTILAVTIKVSKEGKEVVTRWKAEKDKDLGLLPLADSDISEIKELLDSEQNKKA